MPTLPIALDLSLVPPTLEMDPEFDPSVTSDWSQDHIDHVARRPEGLGVDLEHAYGFPGTVIPQAHMNDIHGLSLLFRIGNRYLVFTAGADVDEPLKSWPVLPSITNRFFEVRDTQPEFYTARQR
ncbi:hypothetical protein B0H12DRAFT_1241195 [Mycena haematopus]|nr:hypothetical protein B0H12DRAFT_1241195 [Mycena haematopus]